MNSEQIMPLIVLWIVWAVAAFNIRSHFRHRRMMAQRPNSGYNPANSGSYRTTPAEHPISYRALLLFYWLAAVAVPILTLYLFFAPAGD